MKSKKPFLIVCAAALTLALVLPFMGLFSFAEESYTLSFTYVGGSISDQYWYLNGVSLPFSSFTRSVSKGDVISFVFEDDENEVVLNDEVIGSGWGGEADCDFTVVGDLTVSYDTYIFTCVMDIPPVDPFAPVSDGIDTVISVFGDVIDYIINTPDVAIFVAISVASCAIIPMGIILIKKLIKGY